MKSILNRSAVLFRKSCCLLVSKTYGCDNCSPCFGICRKYIGTRECIDQGELPKGMKFAVGNETESVIGACTVMYQVGSRDELFDDLGATHFIRVGTMKGGSMYSAFIKSRLPFRMLQQEGMTLSTRSDRQCIAFTMTCPPFLFKDLKTLLIDSGPSTSFEDYNLADVRSIIRKDLATLPPENHVLDLLQTASFTGPLSNSIYCAEERVDQMSAAKLRNFLLRCSQQKCSIGSWGLPKNEVMELARQLVKPKEPKSSRGCDFRHRSGFEFHDTGPGSTTYVALSVPSVGTCDLKGCVAFSIVAASLSKYGSMSKSSVLMRYLSSAVKSDSNPYTCHAFNLGYLDAGIFGFLLQAHADDVTALSVKLVEFFAKGISGIHSTEFECGKKRLKLAASRDIESCENAAFGLAVAAAINARGAVCDLHELIDSITAKELQATASCIQAECKNGKMAVAVLGDVDAVPIFI